MAEENMPSWVKKAREIRDNELRRENAKRFQEFQNLFSPIAKFYGLDGEFDGLCYMADGVEFTINSRDNEAISIQVRANGQACQFLYIGQDSSDSRWSRLGEALGGLILLF